MARGRPLLGLPGLPVLSCVCFSTPHIPAPPFLVCCGHPLPLRAFILGLFPLLRLSSCHFFFVHLNTQIFFPLVCLTLSCYVSFCEIPLWPQLTQQGQQRWAELFSTWMAALPPLPFRLSSSVPGATLQQTLLSEYLRLCGLVHML